MEFDFRARQRKIAADVAEIGVTALLVTHLPNVRYLCGFTGSNAALVIGDGKPVLFTDGRYTTQAREEAANCRVVIAKGSLMEAVARWLGDTQPAAGRRRARPGRPMRAKGQATLAIEAERMSVATRNALQGLAKAVKLRETAGIVERRRMVKDADEVAAIRRAVVLGASLLEAALKTIRPGVRETEVAAEIEYAARQAGAEGMSFETIVASGARSALPHGHATEQPIPERGFVVLDFGVILAGYCSDMTRTVHVGRASEESRRLYQSVLEAQESASEAARAGVTAGEVDRAARARLQQAGWGKFFTHSTGHGVGLEIHEAPRLARAQSEPLQPGMVVTVEPGAYLPGRGGVRIEDMIVVTEMGREVLTPAAKELIEL
ncbi:MAG TPA: Xaa-Pro peptidase family protein [Terriglobales bacterium]|nr:Xaa-Pro peptidase family protein [Terriglobales bacterium]